MEKDPSGWKTGQIKPVSILLRTSGAGYATIDAQKIYKTRAEASWPLPGTDYQKWYLGVDKGMGLVKGNEKGKLTWPALR